ncbi:MAG TPA: gephyrin-like molybdotransferase Glp [Terriglobia bacterium]|nr:gephyrin-like molybdotransferase Glp [Terriglobia bacterium]
MILTFEQALETVREKISAVPLSIATEILPLEKVRGRILAEDAKADRDYPPFDRSARDGFALRASDLDQVPAMIERRGEVQAGGHFDGAIGPGECVSIMTGAPVPAGADAVVMVEHTETSGSRITILEKVARFANIISKGSEAPRGKRVLSCGQGLGPAEIGLLASIGMAQVKVFRQLRVAILTTGDELVAVDQAPEWFQIRNSNSYLLAAQVTEAGGVPEIIGVSPDRSESLRRFLEQGVKADLLVISGGVSAGKYDLVEQELAALGAEFYFEGARIRPGKPVVFGRAREKFFFGLPGNPVSTFVTFELFVRPAMAMLSGAGFAQPVFLRARLSQPLSHKPDLTMFTPAHVRRANGEPEVDLVSWQGSGDLAGLAAANCFAISHPDQPAPGAGDWADVLLIHHKS